MVSKIHTSTLIGVDAVGVEVEVQIFRALNRFSIVGLPDSAVRESKDRVRCAIESCGLPFPSREVIVSLAPASLPKVGAGFDLAIALGILAADGQIDSKILEDSLVLGELALDGHIKSVPGVVAAAYYGANNGFQRLLLPQANTQQAALLESVDIFQLKYLLEAVAFLNGELELEPIKNSNTPAQNGCNMSPGFGDVVGQHTAKRALEIAAAGGHNLLMIGPPGAGKSMLAKRFISLLPSMQREEKIEVLRVYSALNTSLDKTLFQNGLPISRPFRSPHHTSSWAGIVGGGSIPIPGEVSLAHKGVLFLDEFAEFKRETLESLREPLENKSIAISRARARTIFPADFILVGAMNPCPCGRRGICSNGSQNYCQCSPQAIERYFRRLSGPLLDRIDIHIWVPAVPLKDLAKNIHQKDPTNDMKTRVNNARSLQRERFESSSKVNTDMKPLEIKKYCEIDSTTQSLLEKASEKFQISARSYSRILKLSRTIADMEKEDHIQERHIREALGYRFPKELL